MEKLKMYSRNLTEGNIAKLAESFLNCVTENKDENERINIFSKAGRL